MLTDSLQSKELLIEGGYPGEQDKQDLLDERITTGAVLQDQPADLVKVPHHELPTHSARHDPLLHSLASSIALGKAWEPADGEGSKRKQRLLKSWPCVCVCVCACVCVHLCVCVCTCTHLYV